MSLVSTLAFTLNTYMYCTAHAHAIQYGFCYPFTNVCSIHLLRLFRNDRASRDWLIPSHNIWSMTSFDFRPMTIFFFCTIFTHLQIPYGSFDMFKIHGLILSGSIHANSVALTYLIQVTSLGQGVVPVF